LRKVELLVKRLGSKTLPQQAPKQQQAPQLKISTNSASTSRKELNILIKTTHAKHFIYNFSISLFFISVLFLRFPYFFVISFIFKKQTKNV